MLPDVENHLFRIAQESITNVLKHAPASQLHLTLAYQPLQVQLTVQDDGQGFDPGASSVPASVCWGCKSERWRSRDAHVYQPAGTGHHDRSTPARFTLG